MLKLGLALGGGGARGLAHIGVLKVLDEENLKIHAISGCSMGALIGGLYAYFGNAKEVEAFVFRAIKDLKFIELGTERLKEYKSKLDKSYLAHFFEYIGIRIQALRALKRLSFFNEELTNKIFRLIPDVPIENLKLKYSAIATDLLSGEEVNFTRGSLRQIVKASSAIPGIFPPVKWDNYYLIDGSASENVPAREVREIGADRVLGIDVTRCIKTIDPPKNVFEIFYRAEVISTFKLSQLGLREADLVIRPDVRHLKWTDFDQTSEIIAAGEKAAKENISEIRALLNSNS